MLRPIFAHSPDCLTNWERNDILSLLHWLNDSTQNYLQYSESAWFFNVNHNKPYFFLNNTETTSHSKELSLNSQIVLYFHVQWWQIWESVRHSSYCDSLTWTFPSNTFLILAGKSQDIWRLTLRFKVPQKCVFKDLCRHTKGRIGPANLLLVWHQL